MASPASPQTRGLSPWPSYAMVLIVLGSAVYAFSPRSAPAFAATAIKPQGLQVNALLRSGAKILAAGEQGRILLADSPKGPWREAKVEPQRESTLTQIAAVGPKLLLAVGHDGWILRSEDGGESWREASFNAESSDPLLGVAGPFDGKLYAYGAFGKFMVSSDMGKSWVQQPLVETGAAPAAPAAAAAPVADDPFADPFASDGTAAAGGISDRHFNAMTKAGDGSLVLVGERGLIARSTDNGASWQAQPAVYTGSFYGVQLLPPSGLLVYGMRGNVFRSEDHGLTWVKSETPLPLSLYSATRTLRRELLLVGENSVVLVSKDEGKTFTLGSLGEQQRLSAVLSLDSGDLLTAGENGIALRDPTRSVAVAGAAP